MFKKLKKSIISGSHSSLTKYNNRLENEKRRKDARPDADSDDQTDDEHQQGKITFKFTMRFVSFSSMHLWNLSVSLQMIFFILQFNQITYFFYYISAFN